MSGPYIYDPESKRFVTRPPADLSRQSMADAADGSLPSMKLPPSGERRKLIVWLVSLVLFLLWLFLLTLWSRQLSPKDGILSKPTPAESSKGQSVQ